MTWSQNYDPLGNLILSSLVAAIPVVVLLGLLAFWHVRAHFAALAGLLTAAAIAIGVYGMPAKLAGMAAVNGAFFGLFPIGWIVLNAMFVYNLSVETGQFAVLQRQIASVTSDRRIQALLIAFSFGAFIEGAAGFGAPVAITGALMIGLGFKPLEAAKLALIGNTAPVAFGSLGIPLTTLSSVTGLDLIQLSAMVGRQLPLFSLIVPFWLVAAQVGWRGMLGVWPACFVTGASFAVMQFVVSNYHGPWLVDIISAVVAMVSLVLFMKVWKPADEPKKEPAPPEPRGAAPWKAWLPWIFLTAGVFLWSVPAVKSGLNGLFNWEIEVPHLHNAVERVPPVVAHPEVEKAVFKFNALSATGTAAMMAGMLAGLCLGLSPLRVLRVYGATLWKLRVSMLTISLMLALGFVTRYSGTDTTMGLMMAGTGVLFPFFSPIIGWLGVALTGSDTSSNVLFGNLQQVTANQLDLSPIHMAASNSSGGVMGKMIDAQSIVVASVATGGRPDSPDAGTVLRSVFWHSVVLAVLMGLLVMAQAYLMPWIVPGK
ncbi:L-lactate permease [Brevifollis gellanilyticus]|uniref:L-lactate permease n=1 Tax=Brevifollis gellanilyticus TaxID=748831 RepID=A0A512M6D2_9BACT|nr:lactate permease LctP family transporter [Brevifollis gellanilyticus]GEP41901.1 L-lactate permease [Brevifollis gellanilyticus]